MNKTIKKLLIKRFRSFPNAVVEFDNPTFFVGKNGAGKSNFADVFGFLSESMSLPLQAVFDKRGGISVVRNRSSVRSAPPILGIGVVFGKMNGASGGRFAFEVKAFPNYEYEVTREQCEVRCDDGTRYWYDRSKRFNSNVSGLRPALEPRALCLPVVGGDERFAPVLRSLSSMRVYLIEPEKLREMQDPDSGKVLRRDGSNAASVVKELERSNPDGLRRVREILESIVPNTKSVRPKKHGNKLTLEFTQEWGLHKRLDFEAFNMSDGTLRVLGMLMAVFQFPTPSLLVIEEPEATVHPGALGAVLDLIRHAGRITQVVVTTHSPDILDAKWIEDKNLRIVIWQEGASFISTIDETSRKALRDHLARAGELMRANALHPDTDALFKEGSKIKEERLFEEF